MFLFGANVLSGCLNSDPDANVLTALCDRDDRRYVCAAAMGEIRFGAHLLPLGRRHNQIQENRRQIRGTYADRILPVTYEITEEWAGMTRNIRAFEPTGLRLINPWEEGTWISH